MKLGAAFALGGLIVGAVAHPLNIKRAVTTEVVFVTETVADAVVYVDENGSPYLTSTVERATTTASTSVEPTSVASFTAILTSAPAESPQPAPAPPLSPSPSAEPSSVVIQNVELTSTAAPIPPAPAPTSAAPAPAPTSEAPAPVPEPTVQAQEAPSPEPSFQAQEAPAPQPSAASADSFPLGITYDPYKGTNDKVDCKTADEITADFNTMKDYKIVRIYGNDCGQIPVAVRAAKQNGQKLMGGIYAPLQDVDSVVSALSDAVKKENGGSWDIISLVSVENERVNAKAMTASDAQSTIDQARTALRNAGFNGPVGAVETVPAVIDNPGICSASDMVLVNVHAWFDPNTKAADAGKFVKSEVARVKKACGNKRVVVTESGWPHQGDSHDQAVASPDAQKAAIASIRAEFSSDLFLFNAFDTLWKSDDASTFNAEKYWGIL
ncbi:glycoside hydrolase [Paraphaeosphaeria sporulosa]|uniref:Glycoside hydrolase n=1 Tax=Paraphaeosphaeria sporulosa TaxID=1460663 RepID=A0A177BYE6_9PLEO|nr:glycoside hydrolase [Paraphaeosphaeria sporulosa]OAF99537.1 glycoside hydrolase [Paraphaeosphaeria sporulosa]